MANNIGYSKVFLLDKYFNELQKYKKTEEDGIPVLMQHQQQQRRNRTPISSSDKNNSNSYDNKPLPKTPPDSTYVNMVQQQHQTIDDLIKIKGPITEDNICKCIQNLVSMEKYHVNMGPILLLFNPVNPITTTCSSSSIQQQQSSQQLQQQQSQQHLTTFITNTLNVLNESNNPQSIILSGYSGSGKTYNLMLILKILFNNSECFRQINASLEVVKALGSAKTKWNHEASRVGFYIDTQVTDKQLTRAKLHCYFLDQSRLVGRSPLDSNYLIFYQMLAGLTDDEKKRLYLGDHTPYTLNYLDKHHSSNGTGSGGSSFYNNDYLRTQFNIFKQNLAILGIPFNEVVRVFSSILLLGNSDNSTSLGSIASLLGVSESALRHGLTTRTINLHNQLILSKCDSTYSNHTRDNLAKSLYIRTFSTIVRRANSTRSSLSSDTESRATTTKSANSMASKSSLKILDAVSKRVTDNSIGVLDLFGFEESQELESLCVNLAAETMQHFYNTNIFKIVAMEEEITNIEYVDNVGCIDLISSLRTGLLSMLDAECSLSNATVENYIQKVQTTHSNNPRLKIDELTRRAFTIQHFAGPVHYDCTDFPETNRDILPDDIVAVFHKHHCSFGFASHLFSAELKILGAGGLEPCPKGILFRISPSLSSSIAAAAELPTNTEPISTLTQDFHTRLDNLLRTLVHAKPHFIRCIKLNDGGKQQSMMPLQFQHHENRQLISSQLRSFQIVETLNLFVNGYPVKLRLKSFLNKYGKRHSINISNNEDEIQEECKKVLSLLLTTEFGWIVGKKYVFLSESNRQELELYRISRRHNAAIKIQSTWRGWRIRKANKRSFIIHNIVSTASISTIKRPQPINSNNASCLEAELLVEKTCELFGLKMNSPPPLPPSRHYTIKGSNRFGFPQLRVMKSGFPPVVTDNNNTSQQQQLQILQRKELVNVIGVGSQAGHLTIEKKGNVLEIPFQYLEFGNNDGLFKEGVK